MATFKETLTKMATTLGLISPSEVPGQVPTSSVRLTSEPLGGPTRFLTYVATDKPIYRAGDDVYVRGVVLDARTHAPLADGTVPTIELKGPKGDTLLTATSSVTGGVWGMSWKVPEEAAGGEYTLRASYPHHGHAPAERKFDVRAYRAPRLKTQIVFVRDGYGPGDKVSATVDVKRAEGGVPVGAAVTATASVDGAEVARVASRVGEDGLCTVSFDLPATMARGEGALAFAIEDGGVVETATKTIPILLQTLDLTFFPEGGELVAGLPARVYVEGRTPAKKPADLEGEVVDAGTGQAVCALKTEHEGRGRFTFTPKAGATYELRVDRPSGLTRRFPLPEVRAAGASLSAKQDRYAWPDKVALTVAWTGEHAVTVTLSQREVELSSAALTPAQRTGAHVALDARQADGVLIATVWSPEGRPLAERLVFREPAAPLTVELTAHQATFTPGDAVELTLRTTRDGKPVAATVGLSVSDDSVLEMVEKREQAPDLVAMVMLEPEVKELADARLYLDGKSPKAGLALDLLLGTQGWRRFALVTWTELLAQHGDQARRMLALRAVSRRERALEFQRQMPQQAAPRRRAGGPPGMPQPVAMAPPPAPVPRAALKPMAGPAGVVPPPVVLAPAAVAKVALAERQEKREPAPRGDAPAMIAAPMPAMGAPMPRPHHPPFMEEQAMPAQLAVMDALAASESVADLDRLVADDALEVLGNLSVREYAHGLRPGRQPNDRVDFTETLYWCAGVETSASTGEAKVSFALNDSVTSFRARAGAFTATGSLGAATLALDSVQPFYVEPKLPLEVTAGDKVLLPVALVNGLSQPLAAHLTVTGTDELRISGGDVDVALAPGQRARQLVELRVNGRLRSSELVLSAQAGAFSDRVTRALKVKPAGFPFESAAGGVLSAKKPASHEVTLPDDVQPGSVETSIGVFPTPLANLTEALTRLIQDPCGCFEQTSSSSYPLTMAQQYFLSHTGVDPRFIEQSKEKLEAGYKRLVGFQCTEKGFEWFGENPGHEALSAYGLLHFTDMAKVRDVDAKMLLNTRGWLLQQRDGTGGFNRKRRALHTWVEDKDSSDAYITWALLEAGEKDAPKEAASAIAAAQKSTNSYVVALGGNIAALAGDPASAAALNQRLAKLQQESGAVAGGTQSIVGSTGESLAVETTALAMLSWLRDEAFALPVERALKYLADVCKGGRYGSTQSTVLALRAIVTYDARHARPKGTGTVTLLVDGRQVGEPVAFTPSTEGAIMLPNVAEWMVKGTHKLELRMDGGGDSEMPFSIRVRWNALTPVSSEQARVTFQVESNKAEVNEGELVDLTVTLTNKTDEILPTTLAIVGLPGGLEPRHDQLKELVKQKTVDAYEVIGREIVLYWRGMAPKTALRVPLSVLAAIPGTYTGPASRAYQYYGDEDKVWLAGLKVQVLPR